MPLNQIRAITADIDAKKFKPIYFLTGEEPFYIDALTKYIEENVLSEEEKGFNQVVFYGRDVSIDDIVSAAKRYPLGADKQVIIVKEAQDLWRTIENLTPYAENPQPSTILVLCYKYKKLDGRKKLSKVLAKKGVVFESKKVYQDKVPEWIRKVLASKGYTITPKAALMLSEFLGTDLSKVYNELQKLQLIIKPGEQITDLTIEKNIGISKDFNNFELQNALGERNIQKSFRIIQYFANNSRGNPIQVTLIVLYNFFTKLYKYHTAVDKEAALKALRINYYIKKDFVTAARNYNMKQVSACIEVIRSIDLKSKGVGATITHSDLLKELIVGILRT